ncbi:MAG: hypothetical protein WC175_05840 [Candidatus Dojkabacteria bacterium]|jgi:hypothetical protein
MKKEKRGQASKVMQDVEDAILKFSSLTPHLLKTVNGIKGATKVIEEIAEDFSRTEDNDDEDEELVCLDQVD